MNPTLLLVEDEPDDVLFFQRSMKKAGIANPLQVAKCGNEALDYLLGASPFANREMYPLPCLVFLDLKLPRLMGIELLRRIRAHPMLRTLIVIVLTSSGSDADIVQAYGLGANAYLVKPSQSPERLDLLKAIKHFWLTYNVPPPLPPG